MRLVDADAIFEKIKNNSYLIKQNNNSIEKGMTLLGIKQAIDEQPTIYDVDRVIKQLEELYGCNHCREHLLISNECHRCYGKEVIDIVKAGVKK